MTATGLGLARCDRARWNSFVSGSAQATIFCDTAFVDSLELSYDLWLVEQRGAPRLGAIVVKDDTGEPRRGLAPFSLYQGLVFDGDWTRLPVHTRVNGALELTRFLLGELETRYTRLTFCLHPRVEDVRPFSWFHYHEPERGRFDVSVAYTGLIDLTGPGDFAKYLDCVRDVRRHEYRKALREGLTVEASADLDVLDALYVSTFERQGLPVDARVRQRVRALAKAALSQGYGELLVCRDRNGKAASATLFLHDAHAAYYLIGANDPRLRSSGSGTLVVLEGIRRARDRGLHTVDVCGMNSPNRGDFKTSLNAVPVPYWIATWERPA